MPPRLPRRTKKWWWPTRATTRSKAKEAKVCEEDEAKKDAKLLTRVCLRLYTFRATDVSDAELAAAPDAE